MQTKNSIARRPKTASREFGTIDRSTHGDLDSDEVGPIFLPSSTHGYVAERLAEKLDSISEVIGEIGGYAIMEEEQQVTAQFRSSHLEPRTRAPGR